MSRIFFYGLFMDAGMLRERGLHPTTVGPAELRGYRLRIGDRATLVPSPRATAYGLLLDLPDEEAATLYSTADVSDYRAESVQAVLLGDRSTHVCHCYNLPPGRVDGARNSAYAGRLSALVLELGFPPAYAREIAEGDGV